MSHKQSDKGSILSGLMMASQGRDKENARPMQSKQILPPSIGAGCDPRSASATSASSGGGRQHKLKQRFTVLRKLGKGTYGKVQLAINKETGQEVAIKTIKKTKIENEQDLERVRREIQIMSSIEHPHIIHIYEVFENKDKIVLIMQYAPGGELYEYVSQSKVLDEVEARRLFRQVATAIYYCHKNKICHRDLKLENILLDEKNNAKLADFGLSNVFDKSRQLKTFCGSPLYASPEIVQGSPYEGPEVDCWSLGVLLYTLVYGAMPFDGSNFKRLVKQISEACYYEPKQRSQASPLISRLLCADPLKRATIFDICQDPWVNGSQSILNTPTLSASPTLGAGNEQRRPSSPTPMTNNNNNNNTCQTHQHQAHTSLLKVAQDMANLTPVRLDILLALTPNNPVDVPSNNSQSTREQIPPVPALLQTTPSSSAQKRKSSLEEEAAKTSRRQQQQQERQTKLMDQLDGPSLMEVDETRATSPVASFVVRDLAAEADEARETQQPINDEKQIDQERDLEQAEAELTRQLDEINEPEEKSEPAEDLKEERRELVAMEIDVVGDQVTSQAPADVADLEQEVAADGDTSSDLPVRPDAIAAETSSVKPDEIGASQTIDSTATLEVEQTAELGMEPTVEVKGPDELEESSAAKTLASTEIDQQTLAAPEAKATTTEAQADPQSDSAKVESQPDVLEDNIAQDDDKAAAKSETTGDTAPQDEAKPKKIKKKIIVVKKRKKVTKKDGQEATGQEVADDKLGEPSSKPAKKMSISSSGPGKVRIPDTFQPSEEQTTPPSTLSRASRRQSALIADVSQKLLQQQQPHPAATAAIEVDQPQLAGVRVSDKKSDFERRASQASAQQQSISPTQTTTKGSHSSSEATGEPYEPQPALSRQESMKIVESIGQTIVEPVERAASLFTSELKPADIHSDPLTPTAQAPSQSDNFSQQLSDQLGRVASATGSGPPNEDRSDSVETIKADLQGVSPQEPVHEHQTQRPNVRSSLQIDIGGSGGGGSGTQVVPREVELDDSSSLTSSNQAAPSQRLSVASGPAPITRSYKKVTFTKDGSCVTETGRIYSTQADDGTMRRIERKSKVTHYPSETDQCGGRDGGGHSTAAIEETHEEIVYEDGTSYWPSDSHRQPTSLQRDRPFERLVMPSSSYFGDEFAGNEIDQRDDDDDGSARHRNQRAPMERMDSASSCSSGSTDVFDDIFDTWTGAISMFSGRNNRRLSGLRDSLMNRAFGGSPSPFADRTPGSARHRPLSGGPLFNQRQHVSSSVAGTPQAGGSLRGERCGSVEPPRSLFETFEGLPRPRRQHQHHHHHHRQHNRRRHPGGASGRSSAEASGYESDVPFEPPASAAPFGPSSLRAARGAFGSSQLGGGGAFPRHEPSGATESLFDESLPVAGDIFESLAHNDPFGGSLLMQEIQLEHEKMRRRMAQHRQQMWKGSTPALNDLPDAESLFMAPLGFDNRFQQPFRSRADSSSSSSHNRHQPQAQHQQQQNQQQQQRRVVTTVFKNISSPSGNQQQQPNVSQSQSSGGLQASSIQSIRQSAPLDPTPIRRNTASLAGDHLPPRQPAVATRKSTSKTSLVTSQLANMQLSDQGQQPSTSHSISGDPSPRHISASFIELKRNSSQSSSQQQQQQQQPTTTMIRLEPGIHSASSSSAHVGVEGRVTPSTTTVQSQASANLLSRLSQPTSSSLSQQDQNEANSRIQSWLQQSSGNLSYSSGSKSSASDTLPSSGRSSDIANLAGGQALRRDESMGTTVTSASMFSQQRQQHRLQHQLPPIPIGSNRPPISSRQSLVMGAANVPNSATSASMTFRSSSRQSMSTMANESGQAATSTQSKFIEERHQEAHERLVLNDADRRGLSAELDESRSELFARQSTSSNTAQASSHSTLRRFAFPDGQDEGEQAGDEMLRVCEERQEQFVTRKQQVVKRHVVSPQPMTAAGDSRQQQQQQQRSNVADDGFNDDFDSLTGSGADLDSISSASLLDQLRARGYRSMINQRMVNTQQQQVTSSHQAGESNVITTSSTSITMSSSGVGGAPPAEAERVTHAATSSEKKHQQQQQQRDIDQPTCPSSEQAADDKLVDICNKQPVMNGANANEPNNEPAETAQAQVNGCNGAAVGLPAHREADVVNEPAEEDEDVRDAKANIKGYLDRMREMEKFLKSMHEEEEKFQKQRQDLFLFNNLLLSTKLNGIKSAQTANNSCEPHSIGTTDCVQPQASPFSSTMRPSRGHSSAPIGSFMSPLGGESPSTNGFMTAMNYQPSSSSLQFRDHYNQPAMSCLSSDLYKPPVTSTMPSYMRATSPIPNYSHDPLLEPVQPLQLSSYHVPATGGASPRVAWRRSKSQLSDQFNDYCHSRSITSRDYGAHSVALNSFQTPTSRRPLSANIDSMSLHNGGGGGGIGSTGTSSAYFPSRQRRSVSQMRHSTAMAPPTTLLSGSYDQAPMMSEYKSSFGPNLGATSAIQRLSPLRRATSPLAVPTTTTTTTSVNNKSDDEDPTDEHDDDMHEYRASSYVPKVIPDLSSPISVRRGRSLSRRSSTLDIGGYATTNGSPSSLLSARMLDPSPSDQRRSSLQPLANLDATANRSVSPNRRRSYTGSGEGPRLNSDSGSRLSELEQRIQANKRRRQELLTGIKTGADPAESETKSLSRTRSELTRAPERPAASLRTAIASAEVDDDDSFGFERPSRPIKCQEQPISESSISDDKLKAAAAAAAATLSSPTRSSAGSGLGSPRSRPSRLESMEARIKRRSYCVRVSSPERLRLGGANKLLSQTASSSASADTGQQARRPSRSNLNDE